MGPDTALSLIQGAKNPEAFARMAASSGLVPPADPATMSLNQKLAAVLEPMTGVTKPTMPQYPEMNVPSAPGAPSAGSPQGLTQNSQLLELLLKGGMPTASPPPSLASILRR